MKLSTSTEWLLFHLWKSNPETGKSCPGVIIPETIIYRWAQPYFWYYTSRDGTIIRKTKDRISMDYINEVFVAQKPVINDTQNKAYNDHVIKQYDNQIVATYMTSQPVKTKNQIIEKIESEYFQIKNFQQFLYQRDKMLSAILQKFVMPYGNKNQIIKVNWTPQFCLFFRKTNINDINDNMIPINERLITFDGQEHFINQDSIVSPTLQKDIEYICLNIIKHIQEVSGGNIQISRMVLYMKMDNCNRLQLLYCTDLRIREKYSLQIENSSDIKKKQRTQSPIMKTINNENKDPLEYKQMCMVNNNGKIDNYDGQHCLYCKQIKKLYDLSFKHIILSYEQGIMTNQDFLGTNPINENDWETRPNYATTLQEFGVDYKLPFLNEDEDKNTKDKAVPMFLEYIWGKLSQDEYENLKQNSTWIQLNTKVCDECYINFTIVSALSQEEIEYQNNLKAKQQNTQSKINFEYQEKLKQNYILEKNKTLSESQKTRTASLFQQFDKQSKQSKQQNQTQKLNENQLIIQNQQKFQDFKAQQQHSNNIVINDQTEKSCKNTYRNYSHKVNSLHHLKQLAHDQEIAKNLAEKDEKIQIVQYQKKGIYFLLIEQKKQTYKPEKKYKNNLKTQRLPKLFKQERNYSFQTTSTQDGSSRLINHDSIMQTIKDLKNHMSDI